MLALGGVECSRTRPISSLRLLSCIASLHSKPKFTYNYIYYQLVIQISDTLLKTVDLVIDLKVFMLKLTNAHPGGDARKLGDS